LIIGALLATAPVEAANTIADIHALLTRGEVICADFVQEKQLKALKRPLLSRGRLVFVAGKGVLWQVREPFAARFLVKSDELIKWDDAGAPQRLSLGQAPVFRALSEVFLAVFTAELKGLEDTFELTTSVARSRWRLTLTPRDPGFAGIIAALQVSGSDFVEELVIREGRGDRTRIRFSGVNTTSCQPSAAEKGYFAQ
jgi:hypothetical protein